MNARFVLPPVPVLSSKPGPQKQLGLESKWPQSQTQPGDHLFNVNELLSKLREGCELRLANWRGKARMEGIENVSN